MGTRPPRQSTSKNRDKRGPRPTSTYCASLARYVPGLGKVPKTLQREGWSGQEFFVSKDRDSFPYSRSVSGGAWHDELKDERAFLPCVSPCARRTRPQALLFSAWDVQEQTKQCPTGSPGAPAIIRPKVAFTAGVLSFLRRAGDCPPCPAFDSAPPLS